MDRPDLAAELSRLVADDENVRTRLARDRSFWDGYHPEMREVHRLNGDRLAAMLVEVDGWLGYAIVGAQGSSDAWLIAIHDIANPALMRRSRDLMTAAAQVDQASSSELAPLVDRIRMFEGADQLYGTQLGFDDAGEFGVWPPIENLDEVDARRQQVGLGPLGAATDRRPDPARPERLSPEELADRRSREAQFLQAAGWRTSH